MTQVAALPINADRTDGHTAPSGLQNHVSGRLAGAPSLAPDVRPIGQLEGSGFAQPQWLVQRGTRFIQLSALLYLIVEHVDGRRSLDEVARLVSDAGEWIITGDQVRYLIEQKLEPLGLVMLSPVAPVAQPESQPNPFARSPLALHLRLKLIGPHLIDPFSNVLQILFWPPIIVAVVILTAASYAWLYFEHGVMRTFLNAVTTPGVLALTYGLAIVGAVFHEFGHAAALRYSGGNVRGMGAGFYLTAPVFFTDVTDGYRLGRAARIRTGLGGIYFNLVFALIMFNIYALTAWDPILVVAILVGIGTLFQFVPFVRLDGYWALTDLAGIPDFLSMTRPFLRSLFNLPSASGQKLPPLTRTAKAIFVGYLVSTCAAAIFVAYQVVTRGPDYVRNFWEALQVSAEALPTAWESQEPWLIAGYSSQFIVIALGAVGLAAFALNITWLLAALLWNAFSRRQGRRSWRLAGMTTVIVVLPIAAAVFAFRESVDSTPIPAGVERFAVASREHVDGPITYAQVPPVGGNHAPIWQNCGFYDHSIASENAVHAMEHGAVWITYDPTLVESEVSVLRALASMSSHVLVSAYDGLPSPVVASAWGVQLRLDTVTDPRLDAFLTAFRRGKQAPESGAACTGGVGNPTT